MIPFSRMIQYANTYNPPQIGQIKKYYSSFYGLYVLDTAGNLYAIGRNQFGQLGLPQTVTYQDTWLKINTDVDDMWFDDNACVLVKKTDGSYWTTGRNYWNSGTGSAQTTYQFINASTFFSSISIKNIVLTTYGIWIIDTIDDLYYCGYNQSGWAGTGNTTSVPTLTKITSNVKKVSSVLDGTATAILKNDGTLWTCGSNTYYQLGYTSPNPQPVLTQVSITSVLDVQMGYNSMYILRSDGIYNCGIQFSGQLGNGLSNNGGKTLGKVTISAGTPTEMYYGRYTCVVKIGTSYYSTGQICTGPTIGNSSVSFTLIDPTYMANLNPTQIQVGYYKIYAIVNDKLFGCGSYNAQSYPNLLPYYTSNVFGLSVLDTRLGS